MPESSGIFIPQSLRLYDHAKEMIVNTAVSDGTQVSVPQLLLRPLSTAGKIKQ